MPTILTRLPFFDHPTDLSVPGGPVIGIVSDQIVFWVSITGPGITELPPHARRLPVVLDTGFNSTFMLREQQLVNWAGLMPQELGWVANLMVDWRQQIPVREAYIWIHPNRPGFRDSNSRWKSR